MAKLSIADAFRECGHAFHVLDESGLDDNTRDWVNKIKELMNIKGSFSIDQQIELSRVIDELAHWFDRKYWSDEG